LARPTGSCCDDDTVSLTPSIGNWDFLSIALLDQVEPGALVQRLDRRTDCG
jgi:hypothetical protein